VSQKNETLHSCSQLRQILTDFQNSFTRQDICNKAIIKDSTTPQMRRYTTL